jgi:hypothetical protein
MGTQIRGVLLAARIRRVFVTIWLATFSPLVLPILAQQPGQPVKVTQITGLMGVKKNTGGNLTVEGGNLHFSHEQTKVEVATSSMQDVVTGGDSQRLVHGTLGTLTMLAPYGSGRFLSLFRTKLDTLTVKYRDTDGGLHGAIFTMPLGKADVLKKELLAQGAHTTAPEEPASSAASQTPAAKEQKQ